MNYSLLELKAEIEDQTYSPVPGMKVIDYEDVMTAIENLEKELRKRKVNIESYKGTVFNLLYDENYKLLQFIKEVLGEAV